MNNMYVYVAVALVSFLVFREAVTWYWKINEAIGLMRTMIERLKGIEEDTQDAVLLLEKLTKSTLEISPEPTEQKPSSGPSSGNA